MNVQHAPIIQSGTYQATSLNMLWYPSLGALPSAQDLYQPICQAICRAIFHHHQLMTSQKNSNWFYQSIQSDASINRSTGRNIYPK